MYRSQSNESTHKNPSHFAIAQGESSASKCNIAMHCMAEKIGCTAAKHSCCSTSASVHQEHQQQYISISISTSASVHQEHQQRRVWGDRSRPWVVQFSAVPLSLQQLPSSIHWRTWHLLYCSSTLLQLYFALLSLTTLQCFGTDLEIILCLLYCTYQAAPHCSVKQWSLYKIKLNVIWLRGTAHVHSAQCTVYTLVLWKEAYAPER